MSELIYGEIISKSQINKSSSKQMYSFSKSERFPKEKLASDCIYNLPDLKATRSTILGYGTKFDFTLMGQYKTPSFYTYKYQVESKHPYAPKYSFSRKERSEKMIEGNPGVGNYNIGAPTGKEGAKYTMKGRGLIRGISMKQIREIRPGPGTYETVVTMNPKNKIYVSNFQNVRQILFCKDKSKRFKEVEKTPGPGDYLNHPFLFGKTSYNSKIKSSIGKSMQFKYKSIFEPNNQTADNPGPGTYDSFSEFSIFDKPSIRSKSNLTSFSHEKNNENKYFTDKISKTKRFKVNIKSSLDTFWKKRKN